MTAMDPHQSYMAQHPFLFILISYYAIAFSFAQMFTNGWFAWCHGFFWCFCLLAESYETINHYCFPLEEKSFRRPCTRSKSPENFQRLYVCAGGLDIVKN